MVMKKQILLLIFLTVSAFAMAQTPTTFGVRAGVTSYGLRGDAMNNLNQILDFTNGMVTTTNHTGFFAGGYANIPVSDIFSVEPGLYYSQKGYEIKGDLNLKGIGFLGANAKANLNANYIDMPVLLKANFSGFQIFAGPQLSYLVSSNLKTTAGVLGINLLHSNIDATSQFNRLDAAATAGIGYQFTNGMNITASYDYGLTRADANRSVNAYNRGLKVGLGVSF